MAGEEDAPSEPAEAPAAEPAAAPEEAAAALPATPAQPAPRPPFTWAVVRSFFVDVYQTLRDHYGRTDPRTAGVFRIAMGLLVAGDLVRHWVEASWAYSNSGVLTNHFHLFRPDGGYNFSLFHAFSSIEEVDVAFAVSFVCALCLLIGWHARLFAVVAFVVETSMDNRLVMVENGGYVVVNLILCYAIFLPIERRFSVDALVRSYREHKEKTVAELGDRYRPAWQTAPYVSFASMLVIVNLAAIYFFNVVNKSGNLWKNGETVHYVLWLNRMVTGIAVVARSVLPFVVTKILTWSVLGVEALLVTWIVCPFSKRATRPLALIFLFGLHTSFGLMMRLGPFSWFLVGWGTLLISVEQWEDLEAWHRRIPERAVVLEHSPNARGLALWIGRLLARVDAYDRLVFKDSDAAADAPLVRVVEADGRETTGFEAARAIAVALPFGRYLFPVLRVLSLGVLDVALRFVFEAPPARRAAIARFFGLDHPDTSRPVVVSTSPLRARARLGLAILRESFLFWLVVCALLQALVDNKSVPAWMKPAEMPSAVRATLSYPRMFQGWGMFAPNPIVDDGTMVVDAITVEGRHVDPFTDKPPELDLTKAHGLGLSQIRQDYFNRLRLERNKFQREGLKTWLLAYPKRTGNKDDEIASFDVYWVRDLCPKPGKSKPTDNELLALITYRKPGYHPRAGLPPLPKEPPVVNADSDAKPNPSATPSASPSAAPSASSSATPRVRHPLRPQNPP